MVIKLESVASAIQEREETPFWIVSETNVPVVSDMEFEFEEDFEDDDDFDNEIIFEDDEISDDYGFEEDEDDED